MPRDRTTGPLTAVSSVARLDAHYAGFLGCRGTVLRQPGIHVVPVRLDEPWHAHGRTLMCGVMPRGAKSLVVACVNDLLAAAEQMITSVDATGASIDLVVSQNMVSLAGLDRRAHWSQSIIYFTDATHFRPHGVDVSVRVELLATQGDDEPELRQRFDGDILVIRDIDGQTVSWAGIQRTSDHAHVIASETRPSHRGRGLATVLTTRATQLVLDQGRVPIWLAPSDYVASQRLVERLGYMVYGEQFTLTGGAGVDN
jgi:GNAT superfamily N-acetyltransferase